MINVCQKCGNEFDIGKLWISCGRATCFNCWTPKPKKIKGLKNPINEMKDKVRKEVIDYLKLNNDDSNHPMYEIVGLTPIGLKIHLENNFTEGMTWENRGYFGWHIDHITPLCKVKTEKEMYDLCHYTNLQPLWRKDNMDKGRLKDKFINN